METYIKAVATSGGTSLTTAKLMKTGQTTSYRTGDDGDLEAGRNVDFFTLAENNPFGNTDRFTDELGGQTYTNNIVIDWSTYDGSTVLGFRRGLLGPSNWNTAIDACLAISVAPFTTGWRLPNITELHNIMNFEASPYPWNHAPLNITDLIWTSTTIKSATNRAYVTITGGIWGQKDKSLLERYIPCRTFTVTGTTLS